ncbi:DoxX family protein, partial [Pseudomonas gingeri]|uniref:DoxX family protein n=1 Tax=Pseudomonas gingeri TaxID=117681 RepID=UPI00159F93F9|nr:DoxX family protein [Pseudomonas gingeri]
MDTLQTTVSTHDKSLRGRWNQLADRTSALLGESLLVLVARLGIAGFFFTAGRSKVEGFLTVSPATLELFRTDYALPFISPGLAAHMAAYAEHLFPLLLVVGLFSRMS